MSTYRTYKAGTKRLTTWLVQAAKLCGVDSTSFATDRYQIPLGEFVELAQTKPNHHELTSRYYSKPPWSTNTKRTVSKFNKATCL